MADNYGNKRRRHKARQRLAEFVAGFEPGLVYELRPFVFERLRAAHAQAVRLRRRHDVPVAVIQVRGNAYQRYTTYPDYVGR